MSSSKRKTRPWRHRIEYILLMAVYGIFRLTPSRVAPALGAVLGEAVYWLIPGRRRITLNNLHHAFKSADFDHRRAAHAAYRSLGKNFMELLGTTGRDRTEILRNIRVEALSNYEEADRQRKGVIVLASHFGNWELMSLAHSALLRPACVVGRALDNPLLDRLINRYREQFGSTVINSKDPSSLRQILSALHRGMTVGFLIDQNVVGDRGVYVDFFGRLAYTHKVLALVALKTGAPVVPVSMYRETNGGHRLVYGKALPLIRTGHRDRDVWANTQMMTRAIEDAIRRSPGQWLWMHDRWKKQPRVGTQAVFLDRDGTITEEVGYIRDIDHLKLLPNSAEAIRTLNRHGIKVIVVTNQSGVARGYYPETHVRQVNDRLISLLKSEGAELDGIYYCPHHPTEGAGRYTQSCGCRKPEPGLLYQAASDRPLDLARSFVVGDKLTDIEMAHRVGATGILVLSGYGKGEYDRRGKDDARPDRIVSDLGEAVQWILTGTEYSGRGE